MVPALAPHQHDIERICRRFRVRRLELFGSAATGQARPGQSDLDFLVEFEDLPPGTYADAYFGLLEGLTALFGRPVDLVESASIRNPYFRQSVDLTKVLIFPIVTVAFDDDSGRWPQLIRRE